MNDAETPPSEPAANGPSDRSFMDDLAGAEPPPPPLMGGFSLSSLFLLVTAAGAIALLARNIIETRLEPELLAVHAVLGGVVGGIAGAIIGLGYPRLIIGLVVGSFVGTLTGSVCAATSASGGSPWLFCVGAAALVGLGLASRWLHRDSQ